MSDEVRNPRSDAAASTSCASGDAGVVGRLFVYPLKSAAGLEVDAVDIDAFGPRLDRRWMVVDDDGRLVTQREAPRLALVQPSVDGGRLALGAPGMPRLELPPPDADAGERRPVTVWKSTVPAVDMGGDASEWLGEYLERSFRLVHFPDDAMRRPPPHRRLGPGRISFVDAASFLIITQAALDELNRRLDEPVPMDRFRPNIVIDGADAHAEDGWDVVSIGDARLRRVKPCARCVVTTIDQASAAKGREPLRTLATYRDKGGKVYFGSYYAHEAAGGRIGVGDPVSSPAASG